MMLQTGVREIIVINDETKEDLTAIYDIALGLEHWFPNNNGPFAYGTRLCEETGELIEALQDIGHKNTRDTRHHLIKEVEDVLQIVMGIMGLYGLVNEISKTLSDYLPTVAESASSENIMAISIQSGQFADAINHIESQGIKRSKRGDKPAARLAEKAKELIKSVAFFVSFYKLSEELEKQIQQDYLHLRGQGHIPRSSN